MIVWTVANQKGGVGKTTTVVSLAGILAQRGQRVLLIDTDPHASLTSYLDFDSDRLEGTLYELFQAAKPSAELVNRMTLKTRFENISLLPASITLATMNLKADLVAMIPYLVTVIGLVIVSARKQAKARKLQADK